MVPIANTSASHSSCVHLLILEGCVYILVSDLSPSMYKSKNTMSAHQDNEMVLSSMFSI